MTILALVLAVDALTAAFLLGLVHCKDVVRAPGLPRRVPGAALVDNPPPEHIETPEQSEAIVLANLERMGATLGGMRPQTIGERARARRIDTIEFYRQKYQGAS